MSADLGLSSRNAPKLLLVDNYDSFTWNLVQLLEKEGARVEVRRNDAVGADAIDPDQWDALVVSPGPGTPSRAGETPRVIERFAGRRPILGVCLGLQAIGELFGGRIVRAEEVVHGKTSWIRHDGRTLYRGLPDPFEATRYHSLVVDGGSVPRDLEVSSWTGDGTVMGLRHRRWAIEGVQFHPESLRTIAGPRIAGNFLGLVTDEP